jgi:hypothetical protein
VISLALIPLCGVLDWLRGNKDPKAVYQLLYGLCISFIAMGQTYMISPMAVAFAIGSAPGWSDSYGAIIERRRMAQTRDLWWVNRTIRSKKYLAQAVRALIWGAPCLIVSAFIGGWQVGIAIMIAHFVALPIAVELCLKYTLPHPWKVSEVLRGLIAGSLAYLLTIAS